MLVADAVFINQIRIPINLHLHLIKVEEPLVLWIQSKTVTNIIAQVRMC